MRITQGMMTENFLTNLNNNYRTMSKIQEQLSTNKRINRASDDPVGVVDSLRLRTTLEETEKYTSNVDDANSWLQTSDTALGQAVDILQRVRELTVRGATDSMSLESLQAIAKEVAQMRKELIDVGNTTHDGRFVFSGTQTTTATFDNAGNYQGNLGTIDWEIGINIKMTVNVDGNSVFKTVQGPLGPVPQDVFQVLADIDNDLQNGLTGNLSNIRLGQLDKALDNIQSIRSEVGAKTNRLDMTKARLEDANLNISGLLSRNEDINVADVITQLKMQENTYQTALSAGARIIQPTLVDFLK